jgi:hypothetical protein
MSPRNSIRMLHMTLEEIGAENIELCSSLRK